MKTLEHFSHHQEHMSAKTSCLKATVLSLAVSSSLLTGCQLNTEALSNLVVFDKEVSQQEIAAKKQVLYHAYEQIVPVLNSYYPINSTTYGLIKAEKANTLTALSHEVLANTLTEQGLALCQVAENCPNHTVYLENKVFKEPSLHTMLVSLSTPDLKLTKLFDEQGQPVSTMAINTVLSPIAPPSTLARRTQSTRITHEPSAITKTASSQNNAPTPNTKATTVAKTKAKANSKAQGQSLAKTASVAKAAVPVSAAAATPAEASATAAAAPTAAAKQSLKIVSDTATSPSSKVSSLKKAPALTATHMSSTSNMVAKQQTDAKNVMNSLALEHSAPMPSPLKSNSNSIGLTKDATVASQSSAMLSNHALASNSNNPKASLSARTSASPSLNTKSIKDDVQSLPEGLHSNNHELLQKSNNQERAHNETASSEHKANQSRRVYKFDIPSQVMQRTLSTDPKSTNTSTALVRKHSVFIFDPNMSLAQVNNDLESHQP
ncbi:hypothetical protein MXE38_03580 [Anaerobiospirillum sp. NML120448]|uniref:hypothetical protein n=1 Tax=Anaerobiospirillum sp. NML120448 TaxID=2932816 RepID=UPI001FF127DD|nr:hypothetical protein [Anaerobiospirillum sp. NML120448]MCK0513948.1 hypothetical protein [Anaerobiospirillum sp. NML120448]